MKKSIRVLLLSFFVLLLTTVFLCYSHIDNYKKNKYSSFSRFRDDYSYNSFQNIGAKKTNLKPFKVLVIEANNEVDVTQSETDSCSIQLQSPLSNQKYFQQQNDTLFLLATSINNESSNPTHVILRIANIEKIIINDSRLKINSINTSKLELLQYDNSQVQIAYTHIDSCACSYLQSDENKFRTGCVDFYCDFKNPSLSFKNNTFEHLSINIPKREKVANFLVNLAPYNFIKTHSYSIKEDCTIRISSEEFNILQKNNQ
jgi:hypothetical protein